MEKLALFGGLPVRKEKIFYAHQYIDDEDILAVEKVLKSDFLTGGPEIEALETKLCNLTGAKYAVAVSNGTAALHVACMAAGIKEGDEVITTPMTFAASANCVLFCGAKVIFADIDPETYNIDPVEVEKKISNKTRAVIAVDFTGQAVDLNRIREICKKRNLILIEDAAHSIGTYYNGKPIGAIADITTFSFHPVKTVTCGEGGAIVTNDLDVYNKLCLFRTHGITKKNEMFQYASDEAWYYEQKVLGYNYRLSEIQAGLLCSQLNKLKKFKMRRAEIVGRYNAEFSKIPELVLQKNILESDTAQHLYIIQLKLEMLNADRKKIYNALYAENVCCNVHYIPVYYHPYYRQMGYLKGMCPKTEVLYDRIISLPLYYSMTDQDVEDVIRAVKKVVSFFAK